MMTCVQRGTKAPRASDAPCSRRETQTNVEVFKSQRETPRTPDQFRYILKLITITTRALRKDTEADANPVDSFVDAMTRAP